ncbi:MAG: flagellar assembly peptidoglycan hydrolase FlgJ [Paucibacter sp.]|nr:flagellar assembly peptidoglycan hydrolase FlgJ [Roseateles sp.]
MSSTFNPAGLNTGLASDTRTLDALKSAAAKDPKASIKETAKQFESLFMQEVMKSMRATTLSSGMLDNSASQMGTEMLDQQFATKLTGLPGGLSDAIQRQLAKQMGVTDPTATKQSLQPLPSLSKRNVQSHVQSFIQSQEGAARVAEQASGIPSQFLLAQAAHETGWGRHQITNKDGTPSHNIFGIKATAGWTGKTVDVQTTEYVDGKAQKVTAKFRAYDSYADAYKDYAQLIGSNERYANVVAQARSGNAASFAQGLQKAGYATDPQYAAKLARVIDTTMRVQRALA